MKYTSFHEQQFHQSVATALETVRRILDVERFPVLAAEEVHEYSDKYTLVEYLTNTAVAAVINALTVAGGLQPDVQQKVLQWVQPKPALDGSETAVPQTVTLRFLAEDSCAFMNETDVEVVTGEHSYETITTKTSTATNTGGGVSSFFGGSSTLAPKEKDETTTKSRVVHRVKELHWCIGIRYQLVLFPGTSMDQAVVLHQRQTEAFIVTQLGLTARGTKVKPPLPEHTLHPPVDTNITWLLSMIDATNDQACRFSIDRDDSACATPRRNASVAAAVDCLRNLHDWSRIAQGYFCQRLEKEILAKDNPVHPRTIPPPPPQQQPPQPRPLMDPVTGILEPGAIGTMQGLAKEPTFNGQQIRIVEYNPEQQRYKAEPVNPHAGLPATLSIKPGNIRPDFSPTFATAPVVGQGPPLHTISDQGLFCPILPLMEHKAVLGLSDVGDFLQEQSRSLDEALDVLGRTYPAHNLVKLVSVTEATLVLLCKHLEQLTVMYHDSVDYVEDMLKQQLVTAIGKEVTRVDFEQFMKFYYPKFFGTAYAPVSFCHAIRRPGHYPDGIVSIEALPASTNSNGPSTTRKTSESGTAGTTPEPISTWVRRVDGNANGNSSLFIPIHASANVEITGDRYLHGWMQQRFQSKPKPEFQLACRARQFSSFLIILGTVAGYDKFEPKDAIILQNKDEVLIPLLTTVLPSAKEFKDAIHSLSPEQQEFARAFRGMQLESSVFGICIVQIKPQLEKLLGLPNGSLTKEIQLTQDLMSLFVDYQVPSDLMTFEGPTESTLSEKVESVREHVDSIKSMIEASKTSQLKNEQMKADMRYELSTASAVSYRGGIPVTAPATVAMASCFSAPSDALSFAGEGTSPFDVSAPYGSQTALPGQSLLTEGSEAGMASSSRSRRRLAGSASQARQSTEVTERMSDRTKKKETPPIKSMAAKPSTPRTELSHATVESMQPSRGSPGEDFTLIPKVLDAKLDEFELDNVLRSTIIKAGTTWTRTRQANFLTSPTTVSLGSSEMATERTKAFDLLDAISRSGTLAIDCAELHVFVALSHCFDNDVMGTVVQDNINPIAKIERSSLLLASTIYGTTTASMGQLIQNESDRERLQQSFPRLFALLPSREGDLSSQE